MKSIFVKILILVTGLSLVGCTMNNQDAGTLTGGVIGGLVGSRFGGGAGQVLAIAGGTVAGAVIGNAIGQSMDNSDRARMSAALENNNVGQPAYWRNGRSGATYKVTPVRNVTHSGNPYCREYRSTANINGKAQQVYGTACRQPDGSWKIVNS